MNLSNIDWKKPTTIIAVVLASLAVMCCGIFAIIGSITVISTATAILSTVTPTATTIPPTATAIPPTATTIPPTVVPTATIIPCTTEVKVWLTQLNPTVEDFAYVVSLMKLDLIESALETLESVQSRLDVIEPPSCDPRAEEVQQLFREATNKNLDAIIYLLAGDKTKTISNMEMAKSLVNKAGELIEQMGKDYTHP